MAQILADSRYLFVVLQSIEIQNVENICSGAISDHGFGACWIAHIAREEFTGHRYIHLRNQVVIDGSFINDPIKSGSCVGIAAETVLHRGEAEVDKQEFLLLIPVIEHCRVGVDASRTPVGLRRDRGRFERQESV
jgi:hypothetical protein